jgi:hypothetical protein
LDKSYTQNSRRERILSIFPNYFPRETRGYGRSCELYRETRTGFKGKERRIGYEEIAGAEAVEKKI